MPPTSATASPRCLPPRRPDPQTPASPRRVPRGRRLPDLSPARVSAALWVLALLLRGLLNVFVCLPLLYTGLVRTFVTGAGLYRRAPAGLSAPQAAQAIWHCGWLLLELVVCFMTVFHCIHLPYFKAASGKRASAVKSLFFNTLNFEKRPKGWPYYVMYFALVSASGSSWSCEIYRGLPAEWPIFMDVAFEYAAPTVIILGGITIAIDYGLHGQRPFYLGTSQFVINIVKRFSTSLNTTKPDEPGAPQKPQAVFTDHIPLHERLGKLCLLLALLFCLFLNVFNHAVWSRPAVPCAGAWRAHLMYITLSALIVLATLSLSFQIMRRHTIDSPLHLSVITLFCLTHVMANLHPGLNQGFFISMHVIGGVLVVAPLLLALTRAFCRQLRPLNWLLKSAVLLALVALVVALCAIYWPWFSIDFQPDGALKELKKVHRDLLRSIARIVKELHTLFAKSQSVFGVCVVLAGLLIATYSLPPPAPPILAAAPNEQLRFFSFYNRMALKAKRFGVKATKASESIRYVGGMMDGVTTTLTVGVSLKYLRLALFLLPVFLTGLLALVATFWPRRVASTQIRMLLTVCAVKLLAFNIFCLVVLETIPVQLTQMADALPLVTARLERRPGWVSAEVALVCAILSLTLFLIYMVICAYFGPREEPECKNDVMHKIKTYDVKKKASEQMTRLQDSYPIKRLRESYPVRRLQESQPITRLKQSYPVRKGQQLINLLKRQTSDGKLTSVSVDKADDADVSLPLTAVTKVTTDEMTNSVDGPIPVIKAGKADVMTSSVCSGILVNRMTDSMTKSTHSDMEVSFSEPSRSRSKGRTVSSKGKTIMVKQSHGYEVVRLRRTNTQYRTSQNYRYSKVPGTSTAEAAAVAADDFSWRALVRRRRRDCRCLKCQNRADNMSAKAWSMCLLLTFVATLLLLYAAIFNPLVTVNPVLKPKWASRLDDMSHQIDMIALIQHDLEDDMTVCDIISYAFTYMISTLLGKKFTVQMHDLSALLLSPALNILEMDLLFSFDINFSLIMSVLLVLPGVAAFFLVLAGFLASWFKCCPLLLSLGVLRGMVHHLALFTLTNIVSLLILAEEVGRGTTEIPVLDLHLEVGKGIVLPLIAYSIILIVWLLLHVERLLPLDDKRPDNRRLKDKLKEVSLVRRRVRHIEDKARGTGDAAL